MTLDLSKFKPSKKNILVTVSVVFLIWLFYFIATHGFVTVEYNNSNNSTVNIVNSNNESNIINEYSSGKRVFVKKGSYNIGLSADNNSGFAVTDTAGFLMTKKIVLDLNADANIVVAASVNNGCIDVSKGVVYEYSCFGSDYLAKTESATASQPAYTTRTEFGDSILYGSTTLTDGTQVQIKKYLFNDYNPPNQYSILVNGSQYTTLDYDLGKNIGITNYLDGFIVYSKDKSVAFAYKTPNDNPVFIDFKLPNNNQGLVVGTTVKGKYITQYMVSSGDIEQYVSKENNIAYFDGKEVKNMILSDYFTKALVCEDMKLCTIGTGFSVYDISDNKPRLISKVFDGQDMVSGNDDLYVSTANNVLKTLFKDPIQYDVIDSYLSADSCGLYYFDTIYGCRVVEDLNKNLLVKYDTNTPKTEDIINKIVNLSKHQDISSISINNQFIYINGVYPRVTNENGSSTVNPEQKASIKQSINNAVDEQEIDRAIYTVRIL